MFPSVDKGKGHAGVTVWKQFAAVTTLQQCSKRYLLVQHPHVGHLPLVVLVQPPQLFAHLLYMVVFPDQLDVVLSHRLQLVLQLGVLAGKAAVQGAGESERSHEKYSRKLQELVEKKQNVQDKAVQNRILNIFELFI